jgi:hypothetical protein
MAETPNWDESGAPRSTNAVTTVPPNAIQSSSGESRRRSSVVISMVFMGIIALSVLGYLIMIVLGQIQNSNRLEPTELALAVVTFFLIALIVHPNAIDRFRLVKLPGGIELKLSELQQRQERQETYLDVFYAILSNELTLQEKHHLRALARGGEIYTGCDSLWSEFFRLMRFGLIAEVPGQKIGDVFNGKPFTLNDLVSITPNGSKFLIALDKIEAH